MYRRVPSRGRACAHHQGRALAHSAEQRTFAANASHELRTPLAITQALLDVARNDLDRDTDELVERLHINTRAIDLTEPPGLARS